jgi:hypothetical protein
MSLVFYHAKITMKNYFTFISLCWHHAHFTSFDNTLYLIVDIFYELIHEKWRIVGARVHSKSRGHVPKGSGTTADTVLLLRCMEHS